jgi:hypothetical protein
MMVYVSMVDNHTGAFLGAFIINRETEEEAQRAAVNALHTKTGFDSCVNCKSCPIEVGAAIPAGVYGKILSLADMHAHAQVWGDVVDVHGKPAPER